MARSDTSRRWTRARCVKTGSGERRSLDASEHARTPQTTIQPSRRSRNALPLERLSELKAGLRRYRRRFVAPEFPTIDGRGFHETQLMPPVIGSSTVFGGRYHTGDRFLEPSARHKCARHSATLV